MTETAEIEEDAKQNNYEGAVNPDDMIALVQNKRMEMILDPSLIHSKEHLQLMEHATKTSLTQKRLDVDKEAGDNVGVLASAISKILLDGGSDPFAGQKPVEKEVRELTIPDAELPSVEITSLEMSTELSSVTYEDIMETQK